VATAAGEEASVFRRMMALGLEVKQVVQQINRRGAEAESSEGKQRFCQHRGFANRCAVST
jgi:hypothetical protein